MPVYSREQQQAVAEELQACSSYAPANFCRDIFGMLGDYHVMRRQSLACRNAYGVGK